MIDIQISKSFQKFFNNIPSKDKEYILTKIEYLKNEDDNRSL